MSPSGWKDERDGDIYHQQSRRMESQTEDRDDPRARDPRVGGRNRRAGAGGGEGGDWRSTRQSSSGQEPYYSTGRDHKGGSNSFGLGDHCRDNSSSRNSRGRENWGSTPQNEVFDLQGGKVIKRYEIDNVSSEVRNDLRKEIGKIKKALNLDDVKNSGESGFSIKRLATDNPEGVKPKKKKRKKKNKTGAAVAPPAAGSAETQENGNIKDLTKTNAMLALEKDNSILRKKLQELLDENRKLKVDFQSLKRKWDDADVRIVKLELIVRDKDSKLVELEREGAKIRGKLESKNRLVSSLERDHKIALEKIDHKRKVIRNLDDNLLKKDEEYKAIKKEVEEKDRYLIKLKCVKDELQKENEKVKKLAKCITNDSDVLVAKLNEKDDLIKELKEEKVKAVHLNAHLDSTVSDQKKMLVINEAPEIIFSEKYDSSVEHEEFMEDYMKDDAASANGEIHDSKSTIDELPDSLFDPPSDSLYISDEDALKVTSTDGLNEVKVQKKEENIEKLSEKKILSRTKPCPFKLKLLNSSNANFFIQLGSELLKNVVPCWNVSDEFGLLVTLDDFARIFYPKLSIKRVGIILEEMEIPFYHVGGEQEHQLNKEGMRYYYNPIPLIMIEDIEKQKEDLELLFSNF